MLYKLLLTYLFTCFSKLLLFYLATMNRRESISRGWRKNLYTVYVSDF